MATATKNGLGKNAYNEAVKQAQNAAAIAEYDELIAKYEAQRADVVSILRQLRQVHVDNHGARGSDQVAGAVSNLTYDLQSIDRNLADYKRSLDRLKGSAPVDENDD